MFGKIFLYGSSTNSQKTFNDDEPDLMRYDM